MKVGDLKMGGEKKDNLGISFLEMLLHELRSTTFVSSDEV